MLPLVELLQWQSDGSILLQAQSEFVSHQIKRTAILAASVEDLDFRLAGELKDFLSINDAKSLFRVLLAPQITSRLRSSTPDKRIETGRLIVDSLRTEAATTSVNGIRVSRPCWTILGDTLVLPSGEISTPAYVERYPPIDVASPQACSINSVSSLCDGSIQRSPMKGDVVEHVVELLSGVRNDIERTSPLADALIRGCGISLVLVEQQGARLSSSTHGLYVGRITVASQDWKLVGPEDLADSLVHEAIHCVLLMLDYNQPLLLDDNAAELLPPIASPWTGKLLPVPTYLHACFVWFGLAQFWHRARAARTFSGSACERLLNLARKGFLRGSLLDRLSGEGLRLTNERAKLCLACMQDVMVQFSQT